MVMETFSTQRVFSTCKKATDDYFLLQSSSVPPPPPSACSRDQARGQQAGAACRSKIGWVPALSSCLQGVQGHNRGLNPWWQTA